MSLLIGASSEEYVLVCPLLCLIPGNFQTSRQNDEFRLSLIITCHKTKNASSNLSQSCSPPPSPSFFTLGNEKDSWE